MHIVCIIEKYNFPQFQEPLNLSNKSDLLRVSVILTDATLQ